MWYELHELDVFYISYDEPNAEKNWADLCDKVPWAKRIHGVKGFDNAHKECARQSETDRFITVDGDNILRPEIERVRVYVDDGDDVSVFSWAGRNTVNGLIYGNGGVKCWPREAVLRMKTHENAEEEGSKVDFCWNMNYLQQDSVLSDVYINGSAKQAFRAGFREGVKMSLDRGFKVEADRFKELIHDKNLERLIIWCSVGSDVVHGEWAIYGARLGCMKTNFDPDFDFSVIADYDWFEGFWDRVSGEMGLRDPTSTDYDKTRLKRETQELGAELKRRLCIPVAYLDEDSSEFFRAVYRNPSRLS